jgi:hypothetical protein
MYDVDVAANRLYELTSARCQDNPRDLVEMAREEGFYGDEAKDARDYIDNAAMETIEGMTDKEAVEALTSFASRLESIDPVATEKHGRWLRACALARAYTNSSDVGRKSIRASIRRLGFSIRDCR